jgi:glutamine transport system permease protein
MPAFSVVLLDFLDGAKNTIFFCVVSFPLALVLGLLLALMSNSRLTWLKVPARIYVEVMRSTPLISQVYIIYFGVSGLLAASGLAVYVNTWTVGIASLALNYAAYEAEVFRSGILSVDRGQGEAALSLGLTSLQSFFRIIFPQSIPLMIPPFVNDLIYMLKDSAIISVIGGAEITTKLDVWRVRFSSNPLPFFAIAMVLYLILSLPTSYFARAYERRLRSVQ